MRKLFVSVGLAVALLSGTVAHAAPLNNGGGACWLQVRAQAAQAVKAGVPYVGIGKDCDVRPFSDLDYAQSTLNIPTGAIFKSTELAERDDADEATAAVTWRLAAIVHGDHYLVVVQGSTGVSYPFTAATRAEAMETVDLTEIKHLGTANIYHTTN